MDRCGCQVSCSVSARVLESQIMRGIIAFTRVKYTVWCRIRKGTVFAVEHGDEIVRGLVRSMVLSLRMPRPCHAASCKSQLGPPQPDPSATRRVPGLLVPTELWCGFLWLDILVMACVLSMVLY